MHTRRDLLASAGAVGALALTGTDAFSAALESSLLSETVEPAPVLLRDPAVEAYERWLPLIVRWYETDIDDDEPEFLEEEWSSAMALATTEATTHQGLLGQIDLMIHLLDCGEVAGGEFKVNHNLQTMCKDNIDGRTIESMKNALRRMSKEDPNARFVRQRIRNAAEALDLDKDEIAKDLATSDYDIIGVDFLKDFARRHGVSMDYMVTGDVKPLLRAFREVHPAEVLEVAS